MGDVRLDTEKKTCQIRRRDPKLQAKHIQSPKALPPTRPMSVVLWEDNNITSPVCAASHAPALAHQRLHFTVGQYWCASGQHNFQAFNAIRAKRHKGCMALQK